MRHRGSQLPWPRLLLAAGLAAWVGASDADSEQAVSIQQLTEAIHVLVSDAGNTGLFHGADGVYLIDDQFAPLTAPLLAAIRSLGLDPPRYLISTHFHVDHSGGNENRGQGGLPMAMQHNAHAHLTSGYQMATLEHRFPASERALLPDITYSTEMTLRLNGQRVQLIHTPAAHSDGDSFVLFDDANVVHAGDLLINGGYPFIDVERGGSLAGLVEGVRRILRMTDSDSRIIPGQGPVADRPQLMAYHDMLATALERLKSLKADGLDVDEAIEREPLADFEDQWGTGIYTGNQWIRAIYPAIP